MPRRSSSRSMVWPRLLQESELMASDDYHQDREVNLGLPESCSVAGVDAAREGWVVVRIAETVEAVGCGDFDAVLRETAVCELVGVDIPIGLPDVARRGGRECDRLARKRLGRRSSTVFSAPPRVVLDAVDYREALELCRTTSPDGLGLSIQAFNIVPRIREVDDRITPSLQERMVEIHPELAFSVLYGSAIEYSKHDAEGRAIRRRLLEDAIGTSLPARPVGVGASEDDLLDACAVALSAARVVRGDAVKLPESPGRDARGLRLEINF